MFCVLNVSQAGWLYCTNFEAGGTSTLKYSVVFLLVKTFLNNVDFSVLPTGMHLCHILVHILH